MGKLDDLRVVKDLQRASTAFRPAVSAFVEAIGSHVINYRAEVKHEKLASNAAANFEEALAAAEREVKNLADSNPSISSGLLHRVTTDREEYAVDMIVLQRARNKFNSRKRDFESQPMMAQFLVSPRAKGNDIFKADDDPRNNGRSTSSRGPAPDGILPGKSYSAKKPTQKSSRAYLLILVGTLVTIVIATCISSMGSVPGKEPWSSLTTVTDRLGARQLTERLQESLPFFQNRTPEKNGVCPKDPTCPSTLLFLDYPVCEVRDARFAL